MNRDYGKPFIFVACDKDSRAAYYIFSGGFMQRYLPAECYANVSGEVIISNDDLEALLKPPISRQGLLDKCDKLFLQRAKYPASPEEQPTLGEESRNAKKLMSISNILRIGQH